MCIAKIFILYALIIGIIDVARWYRWINGPIKTEKQKAKKAKIDKYIERIVSEVYIMTGVNKERIYNAVYTWMPVYLFLMGWAGPALFIYYKFIDRREVEDI